MPDVSPDAAADAQLEPTHWERLEFPSSSPDFVDALVLLLREFRIPAAVSHSQHADAASFMFIPLDGEDILALADDYAPVLRWVQVDEERFYDRLDAIVADDATETSDSTISIDALAWVTTEGLDALRYVAGRSSTALSMADVGDKGIVVVPANADAAWDEGYWATGDLSVWCSGGQRFAGMFHRKHPHIVTWNPPWTYVDPSRPGQLFGDGSSVAGHFDDVTATDSDPVAWAARFALDPAQSEQLRVLFRRDASYDVHDELSRILGMPPQLAHAVRRAADPSTLTGFSIVEPSTMRQLIAEAIHDERPKTHGWWGRFVRRRPLLSLAVSIVVVGLLAMWSTTGLIAGRFPSALIPGVVAVVLVFGFGAELVATWAERRVRQSGARPKPDDKNG